MIAEYNKLQNMQIAFDSIIFDNQQKVQNFKEFLKVYNQREDKSIVIKSEIVDSRV